MSHRSGARRRGRAVVIGGVAMAAAAAATAARRRDRAAASSRPADVSFMIAMHAAFRRDLDRLHLAAGRLERRRGVPEKVREGWEVFRRELEFHHQAEDEDLWPKVRERGVDDAEAATLEEMSQEHRLLPASLDSVARAIDGYGDLAAAVDQLHRLLVDHLDHEERAALPIVRSKLTDADWHDFLHAERRRRPARERPTFLAWVLDDAAPADAAAVLHELPPPGRLVFHWVIAPRYRARRLWTTDDAPPDQQAPRPFAVRTT
jgi:iron-sulfur cluster repair protein YtfE (RIC family)